MFCLCVLCVCVCVYQLLYQLVTMDAMPLHQKI